MESWVRIFRGTEFSNNIDNQTTIVAVKDKFTEPGYVMIGRFANNIYKFHK